MQLLVRKSSLSGSAVIPGSKSHTVRAVAIGSLAEGESVVRAPLVAADTLSAVSAYRAMGAEIETQPDCWRVRGFGGKPHAADGPIDVGNSGTTLYIALGSAALGGYQYVFTGDRQIQRRPSGPLTQALSELGAKAGKTGPEEISPVGVSGPIRGGRVELDCGQTSQYLTSLLINCPLASGDSVIVARNLVEKPYVEMTLRWITDQGVRVEYEGFERFTVPGRQRYQTFDKRIPADWSSATFFMCAAAITGATIDLPGLDMNDTQGDKAVAGMLAKMGARVESYQGGIRVTGGGLTGGVFDLKDTPDALPALAVTACFAEGETRITNVAQARLKETDRISVMCAELTRMGASIEELPDGLVIHGGGIHAAEVRGHDDHRVIMALALAGLAVDGETLIGPADALGVTFPNFVELMRGIGANIEVIE